MAVKWNSNQIIQFLKVYEQFPVLWNIKHKDYVNIKLKDVLFKKMWEQLEDKGLLKGMDEKQLKNKIKNLIDVFCQELAKIEGSKKSDCGTEDIYTPKLTWFEAAHFFAEVLSTKHSNSNLTLPSTQNISEEISNSQIEQRDDEEPDTQPKEQNMKPSEGMGPP
ncbi:unnamed protein product [Acanthoscelides obtectus]|uniref:MADF domain-containing protein n=1 Tax=Acanthoscelides obtectus TaxID=200917 RepID=A0A9P0M5S5_ACAOB|nr:unnamed protein product [Acanthoscelides obtectus]CAK1671816.1 hypothetical protein AOBTE_LOCUS28482 [Acanthoscelides obtectus]